MAHFAEINEDNLVLRVLVGNENHSDGGYKWLSDRLGGRWIQASYNATFRLHFPAYGYTYSETLDAFIPPKPYPSWILDEAIANWFAPQPYPRVKTPHTWDEASLSWLKDTQGDPE
jgi:hypothetical protein